MDLPTSFVDAQARVKALSSAPPSSDLLELYAFFKQTTLGDAAGPRPGRLDFRARAKFDAWTTKVGMTPDQAMSAYVALVDRLCS